MSRCTIVSLRQMRINCEVTGRRTPVDSLRHVPNFQARDEYLQSIGPIGGPQKDIRQERASTSSRP